MLKMLRLMASNGPMWMNPVQSRAFKFTCMDVSKVQSGMKKAAGPQVHCPSPVSCE